jgi:hypothetical protein
MVANEGEPVKAARRRDAAETKRNCFHKTHLGKKRFPPQGGARTVE